MPTPIKRIQISERDLTSAGAQAASTDVVYVPGFSSFNDQIIFNEPGITPYDEFEGLEGGQPTDKVFINTADELSYEFNIKNGKWEVTSSYIEPHPENVPVQCETISEFETMFGTEPFTFETSVDYPTYGSNTDYVYAELQAPGKMSRIGVQDAAIKLNDNNDYAVFRLFGSTVEYSNPGSDILMEARVSEAEYVLGRVADATSGDITSTGVKYQIVNGELYAESSGQFKKVTVAPTKLNGLCGFAITNKLVNVTTSEGDEPTVTVTVNDAATIELIYPTPVEPGTGASEEETAAWNAAKTERNEFIKSLASYKTLFYTYIGNDIEPSTPVESDAIELNVKEMYTAVEVVSESTGAFSSYAVSTGSTTMYKNNSPDLSYVYAKNLIFLGLPVIYDNVALRNNIFPTLDEFKAEYLARENTELDTTDERLEINSYGKVIRFNGKVVRTGAKVTSGTEMVRNLYNKMIDDDYCFSHLLDKGEYTVKYITSGGYPTFEYDSYVDEKNRGYNAIAQKMITVAAERGDAVAIIDHTNNPERPLNANHAGSVFNALVGGKDGDKPYRISVSPEFGTMFTPWGMYSGLPVSWRVGNSTATSNSAVLPASFGYLAALAKSIRTNANWLAIAGAARGQVPYLATLNTLERMSNTIADSYQDRDAVASLNAITNIKPYGLTIWGNRTLKDNYESGNLTASSFLNLRNLVSDVKKQIYTACKSLLFEQNNDILWINFKMKIAPLLDQMQTGAGISGYKLIKGTTTEKAKLVATVKLYPVYAIEEFDITVELADQEISVS